MAEHGMSMDHVAMVEDRAVAESRMSDRMGRWGAVGVSLTCLAIQAGRVTAGGIRGVIVAIRRH